MNIYLRIISSGKMNERLRHRNKGGWPSKFINSEGKFCIFFISDQENSLLLFEISILRDLFGIWNIKLKNKLKSMAYVHVKSTHERLGANYKTLDSSIIKVIYERHTD